jgi:hypothetical protein
MLRTWCVFWRHCMRQINGLYIYILFDALLPFCVVRVAGMHYTLTVYSLHRIHGDEEHAIFS